MQHEVQLGPFILRRRIGRGGMGDVWRARHVEQEVDAAIKVILGEASRTEQAQELFRNEVRAMAALHHAGIIMVLDYGHVPEDIEPTSGLVPGSPYLAMQLADDSLASWLHRTWSWRRVRGLVLQVLDALAHAHARGVIHRDLKPENILVMERDDAPLRLKLADFGLAHITGDLADHARHNGSTRGTPSYMAPEQIAGEQREQGPWTDLYALGCLTYQLLCGTTPFRGPTRQLLRAHLRDPIPPLRPRYPTPDGLQLWIAQLLAKDPAVRYRRAADAAHDLLALGHIHEEAAAATPETLAPLDDTVEAMLDAEPTAILPQNFYTLSRATELITERAPVDRAPRQQPGPGASARRSDSRAFPGDWRRTEPPLPSMSVLGAGIGLYGLRPIPLVDRESERDRIWAQIRRAVDQRRPTITMLSGLAGSGKSRLAEWIAQRADELGAAMTLTATHSAEGGSSDGLPQMVARHARTAKLNFQETTARLKLVLSAEGRGQSVDMLTVFALADVLRSTEYDSGARTGPQERHTAVLEYVTHLTKTRPVIVWVDDGQWAADALGFAEMVLERHDLPVAILVTLRGDELQGQRAEAEILGRLETHQRAASVPVAPLAKDDHRRLVQRLLRLEGNLVDRVAERTDGNPLFAVQLVGDWVERGVLRPGSDGFELAPEAAADLPDSIHRLWKTRIDRLVDIIDAEPETTRICLEIAATLGFAVREEEWSAACQLAELPIPPELVDRMIDRGLARDSDRGWTFVHGMLRETLLDLAAEARRAPDHHRLCAMLFEPPFGEAPDRPRRHAQHLIDAGEWDRALQPLRTAIKACREHAENAGAFALQEQYEAAVDALGCTPDDPRVIAGQLERALTCAEASMLDEASAMTDQLEARLDEELSDDFLPILLFLRLAVASRRGQPSDGIPYGVRLLELADTNKVANEREGSVRRLLGRLYRQTGKFETSLHHLERAARILKARGEPLQVGWTHIAIASTHYVSGGAELAIDHATTALELFEAHGNVYGVGHAYHSLGEASRHLGDLEAAERHYRDAIEIFERIDLPTIDIEWVNLGLTLISRRAFDEAAQILERVFSNPPEREDVVAMVTASGLACCAAARDDLKSWRTMFATFTRLRAMNEFVTNDVALVLEIAAEELIDHGHKDKARETLRFARDEWEALGNEEQSQRTDQLLRQLD